MLHMAHKAHSSTTTSRMEVHKKIWKCWTVTTWVELETAAWASRISADMVKNDMVCGDRLSDGTDGQ